MMAKTEKTRQPDPQEEVDRLREQLARLGAETDGARQRVQALQVQRPAAVRAAYVGTDTGPGRVLLAELDQAIAAGSQEVTDMQSAAEGLQQTLAAAERVVRVAARRAINAHVQRLGMERARRLDRISEKFGEVAELIAEIEADTREILSVTRHRPEHWSPISPFRLSEDLREAAARSIPAVVPGGGNLALPDPLARQREAWREALIDPEAA